VYIVIKEIVDMATMSTKHKNNADKDPAKKGKAKVDENVLFLKNTAEIITRLIECY
jgi:hypothetical protein